MRQMVLFTVAALLGVAPAPAQTFPSQTEPLPTHEGCLGCYSTASVPVDPQSFIFLHNIGTDEVGRTQIQDYGVLPLTAFAGAADVAKLRSDLSAGLTRLNYKLGSGIAMASAAEIQGPAPGKDNRVGGTITTFAGQAAGSVSFSHRQGAFDVGGAVAFSKGDHLAKAGAGFSF